MTDIFDVREDKLKLIDILIYNFDTHTKANPIIIGANCWIGANAVILPSVSLADCTIVAAATKSSVGKNCIIGGVTAKIIKKTKNIPENSTNLNKNVTFACK